MLWDPAKFEPLTKRAWDDRWVRERIAAIVADADDAWDDEGLWPADEWDSWQTPTPLKALYVGAAGVVWALDALRRRGHAESRLELARAARRTLEARRENPDLMRGIELPEPARASLFDGESGILTVACRLDSDPALADELHERVLENVDNDAVEVMWGSPGTMLAARAMLDSTGDERWADAWRTSAARLLERRDEEGLWTKRLYGETSRGLGPPHGVVGNVLALLGGRELLDEETRATLERETAAVLARTAVREDGLVNWPGRAGAELLAEGEVRLQWCSGTPGIVASAASYLDEDLLLAGAETIWRAGPHGAEKGPGICHGTAGNGYALLKAFERTQDELWLGRARGFAVHALEQAARTPGRYSLWTGDAGVAVYASDCLDARTRYPIMETWE
jgi:hypothetical protein